MGLLGPERVFLGWVEKVGVGDLGSCWGMLVFLFEGEHVEDDSRD